MVVTHSRCVRGETQHPVNQADPTLTDFRNDRSEAFQTLRNSLARSASC